MTNKITIEVSSEDIARHLAGEISEYDIVEFMAKELWDVAPPRDMISKLIEAEIKGQVGEIIEQVFVEQFGEKNERDKPLREYAIKTIDNWLEERVDSMGRPSAYNSKTRYKWLIEEGLKGKWCDFYEQLRFAIDDKKREVLKKAEADIERLFSGIVKTKPE